MVHATSLPARDATLRRGARQVVLGLVLAAGGAVALSAWAQPGGPGHGPRGGGFGGFDGPGLFMGHPEHGARMVDRMLDGVNASDAQRSQVKQIVQAAAADLGKQHEAYRALREQGVALFAAPVVDARAVEALRQQTLAQHDQSSKRVTQALLDISKVLTPEQRAKLADRARKRAEIAHERMSREQGAPLPK